MTTLTNLTTSNIDQVTMISDGAAQSDANVKSKLQVVVKSRWEKLQKGPMQGKAQKERLTNVKQAVHVKEDAALHAAVNCAEVAKSTGRLTCTAPEAASPAEWMTAGVQLMNALIV